MTPELTYLLLTAILTGILWIPVVIGYVKSRGPLKPSDYVVAPTSPLPPWVNRANRAQINAVENLVTFATVVLIAHAAGVTVRGVKAENKRIRILHARDCALDRINLKNGEFVIEGQADPSSMQDAPNLGLSIRHLDIDNGYLDIHNCRGLTCEAVRITHPVGQGLRTNQIAGSRIDGIFVE